MSESTEDVITVGSHVIVKKQNYKTVYRVTANGTLMLGKDQVEMQEIIGKRFWTTFEMVPTKNGKRTYSLKEAPEAESWEDLLNALPSGNDNRSITDDGTSQRLSKDEILQLQESGKTGKEIIGSLIENSKSFLDKTEYSQEKYLKKKERKYFRFLIICKPDISTLHDVYFKLGHTKISCLRMDVLGQLLSYSDVQSDGLYILYDSGSKGLPAAAMLNRIGANTEGNLIYLHPGNFPQNTIVRNMNFPQEQLDRLISVNIYSLLRLHYQGESVILNNIQESEASQNNLAEEKKPEGNCDNNESSQDLEVERAKSSDTNTNDCANTLKRKIEESTEDVVPKKRKWLLETQSALDLLQKSKARGLVIIAKEHPLNIVNALLPFLGLSRPFVIYHTYREPLQDTYVKLKQSQNALNLRLFSNFLRSYQVLPGRTHPDILTSDTGGYLLTGYFVE